MKMNHEGHGQRARCLRVDGVAPRAMGTQSAQPHYEFNVALLESGVEIRIVQDFFGHSDMNTALDYLHVVKLTWAGDPSPFDLM